METQPPPPQPHSIKTILLVGLALAVCSTTFTLALLWIKSEHKEVHLSGEIINITDDYFVIASARGATTTVMITPQTKFKKNKNRDDFSLATQVMVVGTFNEPVILVAKSILEIHQRKNETPPPPL